ncbi:MAG TPA: HEPN domain-containing protein [Actinomycetota bacterium]|nr:HEPN domain-containing protein [Actinomycetota bacterium]
MAERSRDWIAQARRDLEAARAQTEAGFHEWACFAAQQAAEKAAKAVYERLGGVAWGHSVGELLEGLRERTEVPDELVAAGRRLDRFYVPTRYPHGWESGSPGQYYTGEDAERAIRDSGEILRFCEGLLAG